MWCVSRMSHKILGMICMHTNTFSSSKIQCCCPTKQSPKYVEQNNIKHPSFKSTPVCFWAISFPYHNAIVWFSGFFLCQNMETNLPESINDNYLVEYYNYRDIDKSSNLYHFHRDCIQISSHAMHQMQEHVYINMFFV